MGLLYFKQDDFAIYKDYLQNNAEFTTIFLNALKLTNRLFGGIIKDRSLKWGVCVYIEKFYKQLTDLEKGQKRFCDIYEIMKRRFSEEIFGVEFFGGFESKTTYREFFELCENVAGGINKKFAGKEGSVIAIRMDNSVLWCACFFGILMAGFKPFLVNTRLDEESIAKAVKRSGALCVICDNERELENYVVASTLKSEKIQIPKWENEIILMTSGTTGDAKLVVYGGKAICAQVLTTTEILKESKSITHDSRLRIKLLALLPFYHIFGLSAVFLWFTFFGRTLVFPTALDSDAIRFACKQGEVTHFFAIPAVWVLAVRGLLAEAKKQGKEETLRKGVKISNKLQDICPKLGLFVARKILFKDVREQIFGGNVSFCISGGGFLPDEAVEILNGIGYALHIGYGMTETGITAVELSEKPKVRNLNTVGKPLMGVEYIINDDGVLCVKGDVLHSAIITDNGREERQKGEYFVTEDSCEVDESGRWCLKGRQDDIIIGESGENISPDMIGLKLTPPANRGFCVMGLEVQGDKRPVVILSLSEDATDYERSTSANMLYKQIDTLPITLRPQGVYITTDEIPQNLGKVKRSLLKKMIDSGEVKIELMSRTSDADLTKMFDECFTETVLKLQNIFAKVLGCDKESVKEGSNFIYDLGGSSMAYYNLFSVISKEFGVEFKMDSQNPMFTPAEFARAVLKRAED